MQKSYLASKASHYLDKADESFAARRFQDCIRYADRAEKYDGGMPKTRYYRALSQLNLGEGAEARRIAEEAVERFPDNHECRLLASEIQITLGLYFEAEAMLRPAVEAELQVWQVWSNYAAALYGMQDYHGARDAAIRARKLAPNETRVLSAYANAMKETGDVAEAVRTLYEAVRLAPQAELLRFNLLFTMLFDEHTSGADLLREAMACAGLLMPPDTLHMPPVRPSGTGRIRLGLMSNDFHAHACAYFIIPFLANLDHTRIEIFVYSLNGYADNVTQKIRRHSEHFFDLAGKSPRQIVETVRQAELDVLVDLGGYTNNTPLRYMAFGLAARQVTWLGFPASTGMPGIDFKLTDGTMDPVGNEAFHTEALLRAPVTGYCYYPLVARPMDAYAAEYRTRPTPALANGYITFGCCINLAKISERTLRLWSAVLARCTGSKLLVECAGLGNEAIRLPLLSRMAAAGIDEHRVICVPRAAKNQYLLYHDIDILLDTAPLTAGANACDALWMGVPLVTVAGQACHERISASFLNAVGLPGLISATDDQYVETAVSLASDITQLNTLRMSIRPMFEGSALFNAADFCRWFEQQLAGWVSAYRTAGQLARPDGEGLFFSGHWFPMVDVAASLVDAMVRRDSDGLANVLENISAKWSKHWLVAFALSELLYQQGDKAGSLDLLIDSAMLRKYSLPLYRLLIARLDELGQDKSMLGSFLLESFGIDLAVVEAMPTPSIHEIAGVPVPAQQAEEMGA